MVLVFDLDDTLFEEMAYVRSGFAAVAEFVKSEYGIDREEAYDHIHQLLKNEGRGRIFDRLLQKYAVYTQKNVHRCISRYRTHLPAISLDKEALRCLQRFRSLKKYIVTDGNKVVQANKVKALGVARYVEKVLITNRYGIKHTKPSPYCFQRISEMENVPMSELICVGDNPRKDFVGIKPLGCKTIRINQGMYKDFFLNSAYEADVTIGNIREITYELIDRIRR